MTIKRGDTFPHLEAQLREGETPVNVDPSKVRIEVRVKLGLNPAENRPAESLQPYSEGKVRYLWKASDVVAALAILVEWELEDLATKTIIMFPSSGRYEVKVEEKLS